MADTTFKTTYTPAEVEQLKQEYLEAKQTLVSYLKEVASLIETAGDQALSGESRAAVMSKFDMVDHRLLNRFDVASYEYFEAASAVQA